MTDPIVEEVRKRRVEHCAKFGNDLTAIYADLKATEAELGGTMVKRPARHLDKGRKIPVTG
jgi:hypothetical protein